MAQYKVSYKMLSEQGEALKNVAKMVDGYAERVNSVRSKLGSDQMLASVRDNLQKLNTQLGESRAILNTAGELLVKTVQGYTTTETRQVKKVDGLRAHNRDFYKNPVVVASAGGASAGGAAAMASGMPSANATTVNYTDNSVNIGTYSAPQEAPVAAQPIAAPVVARTATHAAPTVPTAPKSAAPSVNTGVAAGAGVLGAVAVGGAVAGGIHLKKQKEAGKAGEAASKAYDPEKELDAAIKRLRELEDEDKPDDESRGK